MIIRTSFLSALLFAAFFLCLPSTASAKDEWLQVRSKNFFLIGNASEKDIRKAATKLEQFRETFRLVFKNVNLSSSVPTNVIVFKSDGSYRPFKPKRSDGKIDDGIDGYFQPGEDLNYITLSTASDLGVVFHEYVHFIINTTFGKTEVPPWFNEGLAEYYQTFQIEEDIKVKLGLPQSNHLALLQENQLIPFSTFFNVSNESLHENGNHSRSVFYAQAWALIHYLVQSGKTDGLGKFLQLSMSNKPAEQSFQEAFGVGYAQMEKDLRKYVQKNSYQFSLLTFQNKLVFDTDMQAAPISEAEINAYLGDLLYRIRREDDAEPYLRTALSLAPDMSMANTTLGMIRIRQRKYDEAKTFLEKAIAQDPKNHLAYYRYAYLLSREGRDEYGYVSMFDSALAAKMRGLLKRAIEINPAFTESYELLAFINIVNNEELDEALSFLRKALKYQPGNTRYALRMAEIYMRQNKLKEATAIVDRIAKSTDDPELKQMAEILIKSIQEREQINASNEKAKEEFDLSGRSTSNTRSDQVHIRRNPGEQKPTPEQIAEAEKLARMRGLNQSLRALGENEKQVLGRIMKIDCSRDDVVFTIKTDSETFNVTSKDFRGLIIITFVEDESNTQVGCSTDLSKTLAVLSFRPSTTPKPTLRGDLVAIEFVPSDFRFMDLKGSPGAPTYVIEETGAPKGVDATEQRRQMMNQAIRANLRQPAAGEKRELGYVERSECTSKSIVIHINTAGGLMKLQSTSPQALQMRAFTPDVEGIQIGCSMKKIEIPVVFVYKPSDDPKAKVAGELLSLEFVPKSFTLD